MLTTSELKDFLDAKVEQYNCPDFIPHDPIQIPHRFTQKEDIEISAFLLASIAWGNRKSIINNGNKLMDLMGNKPYDFVMNYQAQTDHSFVHRTFNALDLDFFFRALQNLYVGVGFEATFDKQQESDSMKERIAHFRTHFFQTPHLSRSEKHLSNPLTGSAAKRINMFLRWMVRKDNKGVDFGIWDRISPSELMLPLDVHTGNMARKLGILNRTQQDWRALEEIQETLLLLDPKDPVKYDFALFGLGAFENF